MILKVGFIWLRMSKLYMNTNVGIYMTTNVASDDKRASESFVCPVDLDIFFSEFPGTPEFLKSAVFFFPDLMFFCKSSAPLDFCSNVTFFLDSMLLAPLAWLLPTSNVMVDSLIIVWFISDRLFEAQLEPKSTNIQFKHPFKRIMCRWFLDQSVIDW